MFTVHSKLESFHRFGDQVNIVWIQLVVDIILKDTLGDINEREVGIKRNLKFLKLVISLRTLDPKEFFVSKNLKSNDDPTGLYSNLLIIFIKF